MSATSDAEADDLRKSVASAEAEVIVEELEDEPTEANRRRFTGPLATAVTVAAALYAIFHVASLNGLSLSSLTGGVIDLWFLPNFPLETWNFRLIHIAGALALGLAMFAAAPVRVGPIWPRPVALALDVIGYALIAAGLYAVYTAAAFTAEIADGAQWNGIDPTIKTRETWDYGVPLLIASAGGVLLSWIHPARPDRIAVADIALAVAGAAVALYFITIYGAVRLAAGTPFAPIGISFAALCGVIVIMELTRRLAGLALVIIALIFLAYVFVAPWLPGFLNAPEITWQRFFSKLYTDAGVLGPTTAVSSTYIILFIIFAAFLQSSRVGEYFVNFSFALAGRARGGPAKVAIFSSGLMGMINGTSAGNVVATGSLTIPLMKRVGYKPRTAGAVEAAASTGGQIMPPIMGAGAFIMAEITGIPYAEIAIAAVIPAVLYFAAIYTMVDLEAAKLGMRGMREDEIPSLRRMATQAYLFAPILILIVALFLGYSVIRAGALATVSAVVVSWLTPHRMGPRAIWEAFQNAGIMSLQIIAVCACAGVIVGVISLTGVGARFSNLLLELAGVSQLLALFFAMCVAILLGMGMPTTAAYAVAASVVAPGLIELGIPTLTAHFFVFYFAVVSAITPPVALASYAAAGISGSNPMATSVESFKFGLAAFIVPFMFFYSSAILMQGPWLEIGLALISAIIGVYLLSAAVQGWFMGGRAGAPVRAILGLAALCMIGGGWLTDIAGLGLAFGAFALQRAVGAAAPPVDETRA